MNAYAKIRGKTARTFKDILAIHDELRGWYGASEQYLPEAVMLLTALYEMAGAIRRCEAGLGLSVDEFIASVTEEADNA